MVEINKKVIAEAINDPHFSFIETFADAADSSKVTKEMTRLLFVHRKKREQIKERERERVVLQNRYNKKKNNVYMKHEKSSASQKTKNVLVEIETNEEEYKLKVMEQQIRELSREMSAIKLEIDTWKAISYNLRTEMGSF